VSQSEFSTPITCTNTLNLRKKNLNKRSLEFNIPIRQMGELILFNVILQTCFKFITFSWLMAFQEGFKDLYLI